MSSSQTILFSFVLVLAAEFGISPTITPFSRALAQERSEAFREYAANARQAFEKHNTKFFLFRSMNNTHSDIITLPEVEGFCFFKGGMGISVNAPLGTIPFDQLTTLSSINEIPRLAINNNVDHMALAILNKDYYATIYAKQRAFSILGTCSNDIASHKHLFIGGQALWSLSAPIYGIELWNLVNIEGVKIVEPERSLITKFSELDGFSILGLGPSPESGVDLWFCRDSKRLEYVTGKQMPNIKWYIDFTYGDSSSVIPIRSEAGHTGAEGAYTIEISAIDPPFAVTDDSFYLSGYGLPEPDWFKPPKPWWFYTSIVGMVLVIVGAVLVRFGKRWWREGAG